MSARAERRRWFDEATKLGTLMGTWSAIKAGTPEDNAWRAYFDDIGFVPVMGETYTMPCPLPSDLPPNWQPLPPPARRWPDDVR